MAKAPAGTVRQPITERGDELLKLIGAEGGLYVTQEEGQDALAAGMITVDPSKPADDGTVPAYLTEAGKARIGATAPKAATKAAYTLRNDIPPPPVVAGKQRNRASQYPFDTMEVNQTFHVPATAENDTPMDRVSSSVSAARAKYSEEIPGEYEVKNVKTYQLDANGKRVKGPEGKYIVLANVPTNVLKRRQVRDFLVRVVDASDPEGAGVRVWRTL
jgi:hypothetical protein